MERTDDELVKEYLSGDENAFRELFNRYKVRLYAYLLSLCLNEAEAEDLFQETFIKAVDKLARYKPQNKFSAWLFFMARNIFLDRRKNRKESFSRSTVSLDMPEGGNLEDGFSEEFIPSADNPQNELLKKENERIILEAMERLSPEQRETVVLRHFARMSFKEIAQNLNLPIGTVLARFSRGLDKLKEYLDPAQ